MKNLQQSGKTFDELKSVCHPAIFNTVITRSKSLVVAVGNPLALMMSEATMDEPKWCWREFITRCMINKTFIVILPTHFFNLLEIMTVFQGEGAKVKHAVIYKFSQ